MIHRSIKCYSKVPSRNYTIWTTGRGFAIELKDLETDHLRNIFSFIERGRSRMVSEEDEKGWKYSILDELDKRIDMSIKFKKKLFIIES